MATYYVGSGGSDSNAGTSWGARFLTISKAALVVAANDTVYIGPGTYREKVTLTISGTSGNPIRWIGDYDGSHTDGVGGVVRITGSNDDLTVVRTNCIAATSVNYNNLTGFAFDMATSAIALTSPQNWTIEKCHFQFNSADGGTGGNLTISGSGQLNCTIQNCYFGATTGASGNPMSVSLQHSSTVSNSGHVMQNCIVDGAVNNTLSTWGVHVGRVGGITIKNSHVAHCSTGIEVAAALAAGQVLTVLNCIIRHCSTGLKATTTAEFAEDYNTIYGCPTARSNVTTGANSVAYPPLLDPRWFFEATK